MLGREACVDENRETSQLRLADIAAVPSSEILNLNLVQSVGYLASGNKLLTSHSDGRMIYGRFRLLFTLQSR